MKKHLLIFGLLLLLPMLLFSKKNYDLASSAGTMNLNEINLCSGQTVLVPHNGDQTLDPGDIIRVVLHDNSGTTLGNIAGVQLPINAALSSILSGINFGTTYYVSAIAGVDDGTGNVDLTDPDLSVAQGTPIIFVNSIETFLSETICDGGSIIVNGNTFNTSGTHLIPMTSSQGCDSLIYLDLIVVPNQQTVLSETICEGDFVNIGINTFVATGSYSVTLISSQGCDSIISLDLTVLNPQTGIFPVTDIIDCSGTPVTINAVIVDPSPTIFYIWSGPCFTQGLPGAPSIEVSCPGTYTLFASQTVGGVTCNSAPFSVEVMADTNLPIADAGPDQTINCSVASVTLGGSGSSTGSTYAYSWTGANGFSASTQFATVSQPGEYCFFMIDLATSCVSASDCVTVFGDATIPTAVATASSQITCVDPSVVLSGIGSSTGANYVYSWSLNGIEIGNGINEIATVPGVYTLEVTNTDNGCFTQTSVVVTMDTNIPVAVISVGGTLTCDTGSVTLDGTGSSTGNSIAYLWTNGANTSTIIVSTPGTYTLTVTDVINGCTSSSSTTVTADQNPPIADAGPDFILNCSNNPATLEPSVANGIDYQWTTFDGNIISTTPTQGIIVDMAGTYLLTATNLNNGCTSSDEVVVTGDGGLPVDVGEDTYFDCNLTEMVLVGNNIPTGTGFTYQWSTNDGIIISGGDTPSPTVGSAGTYILNIDDSVGGCIGEDEITISDFSEVVSVTANMNLSCDAQIPNELEADINFTNLNLSYSWTTSDGSFTSATDLLNPTVDAAGTYFLTVTDNANSCTATASIVMGGMLLPTAIIDVTGNTVLDCNATSTILTATNSIANSPVTYEWSLGGNVISTSILLTVTSAGIYELVVTDSNGCSNMTQVEISANQDGPGFTLPSEVMLNCNNNFEEEVGAVITLPNQNISYEWVDVSGLVLSSDSSIIFSGNNSTGLYYLILTNLDNGCTEVENFVVTYDGFDIDISTTPAGCDLEDGTATATTILPNSLIEWSNGDQGSIVSGLAQGYYSVTVTDTDNNCSRHENFFIDEDISCKVVISGYVLKDPNNTCTYDSNMEGVECVMVKLDPLGIFTMTDATGYYEFIVEDGIYTVEYIGSAAVDLQCPTPGTYDVTLSTNGSISGDNHFYVIAPLLDLCITKFTGNARPGFLQFNCVQVCNYSATTEDAVVTFMHDSIFAQQTPWPNITPATGSPIASNYMHDAATNTFTWNLNDMAPNECIKIMWYMPVPLTAMPGYSLCSEAKVTPIITDINPANNCLDWKKTVTASYDPNDKRNFVGDSEWGGAIYEDDVTMEYAIRFQNVGTDTAFTVVVRDTLDEEYLDVTTVRGFTASHDLEVQFEDSNVLVFTFNNILLVDSMTNEPASNGWISFDIDRKPNQTFGTEITNQAAIYFDFNAPVITNELVNVLTNPVSIFSPIKNTLNVEVTPTLTNDEIRVHYVMEKINFVSMQVYNVGGVLLQDIDFGKKQAGEHLESLSLKDFTAGVYFVFVKTEEGSAVRKVVKF